MKRFVKLTLIPIIALLICNLSYGVDLTLKTEIKNLYDQYVKDFEAKDYDKVMSYYSDNFRPMATMAERKDIELMMKKLFDNFEELKLDITQNDIKQVDDDVIVLGDVRMDGKKNGEWEKIVTDGYYDTLKKIDGEWKFTASGNIDQDRMPNIKDGDYKNESIGYSMSAPTGWKLLPIKGPMMKDCMILMNEEGRTPGFFGYVEVPYNAKAKEAVLGDDAAMRRLSAPNSFKTESMKPVKINDNKGFESVTSFTIDGEDLRRRRVYLDAGGLLYVFVLTAPQEHYDSVTAPFDEFMNSFQLTDEAKKSGAEIARSKQGSGEVQGRVFTDQKSGCQIAAPKGWSIKSTPIQRFNPSISIMPPEGNSVARLLAQKTGGVIKTEDLDSIFKRELEGVSKLVEDYQQHGEMTDVELGGVKGKQVILSFKIEGLGEMKRREIMLVHNGTLFILLCDANPPSEYEALAPKFDEIVNSFTVN